MTKAPKKIRPRGMGRAARSTYSSLCTEILRSAAWITRASKQVAWNLLCFKRLRANRTISANVPSELRIEVGAIQLKFVGGALSARIYHMRYGFVLAALAVATCASGQDQTYKVNSGSAEPPQTQKTRPQARPAEKRPQSESSEKELGWGSNIQTARLARAAENALRSHNYAAAVDYAQRAAQSAPNDPQLWFLLGYTARLAGKSQLAVEAYDHGLRMKPSSLEGMSGLAQTYSAMGRKDEAQALLNRILAADPKRTGDLMLLGEIFLQTGQYDQALGPLERAERWEPAARSELLLALAYQRMKQFDDAKRYLEIAKKRSPNNPEVLRSLAGFYRETGNYAAAISALKGIRSPAPDVKAELAYTYQLSGKPEEAAQLYSEAADA